MLFAGAVASITMFLKDYELYTMLWVLLVVLIIFYMIGDIVRYIYASVRPRILPETPELETMIAKMNGQDEKDEVIEIEEPSEETETEFVQENDEYDNYEYSQAEENEEGFMGAYEDSNEGYTDENLDEM